MNWHWHYAKQTNEKANVMMKKVQSLKEEGGEGVDLSSGSGVSNWLMPGMLRTVTPPSQSWSVNSYLFRCGSKVSSSSR